MISSEYTKETPGKKIATYHQPFIFLVLIKYLKKKWLNENEGLSAHFISIQCPKKAYSEGNSMYL